MAKALGDHSVSGGEHRKAQAINQAGDDNLAEALIPKGGKHAAHKAEQRACHQRGFISDFFPTSEANASANVKDIREGMVVISRMVVMDSSGYASDRV